MSAKGKVKPAKFDTNDHLVMRFVSLQRETVNEQARSVSVIVATENPVERYDDQRGYVVREVLDMDGLRFRNASRQLPIVDSHDRSTVGNVLGSVRNLRVEGDTLVGEAYFARDDRSQEAFTKLLDGHLTDFSITASPSQIGFVERGKQYTTSRGVTVDGPADIVTDWTPTDASLVATGADARSTVRRSYTDLSREVERNMDETLLEPLVAMGMPAGMTDPNMVLAWVVGNLSAANPPAAEPIESADMSAEEPPKEEEIAMADEPIVDEEMVEEEITKAVGRALAADRKRCAEIRAICGKAGIERAVADALCNEGCSLDHARKQVLERMETKNKPIGTSAETVRVVGSEVDRYNALAGAAITRAAFQSAGLRAVATLPAPTDGEFQHVSLRRISERFVERMGGKIDRMAPKDIALIAMGHPGTMGRFHITREAYHNTGSFANLMLDAANKTLLAAYEEAPYTWEVWARRAGSVPDFKNINRIRFSESPNPEHVPENHVYPEGKMSDQKESYKVEKYGSMFTVTWETVVNDDLDAISRIPAMQGTACRRKQNEAVYGVLTANALLGDGGALFNATAQSTAGGHANAVLTGGAAPSVTTLNAAFVSMMTQKGVGQSGGNGPVLNIVPAFLMVPVALSATALELLGSMARPEVGGAAAGNSNTLNIYGPTGGRALTLVVEPVLDANSATAWYLAARNQQVDTVELSFLQGEESPVLENEWDFDHDAYKYKVRQTFGVAAIDHRGLYKNIGT